MRPMSLWSILNAFLRCAHSSYYLFALRPSLLEKLHSSKTLITLRNSLIQVRQSYAKCNFDEELKKNRLFPGSKYPKSEALFFKANQQVEQLSQIIFTALVKVALQLFMLPKFIVSYVVYVTTDTKSESFQLPFPFW